MKTKKVNQVKASYEYGECPDCYELIPDTIKEGEACLNCGHIFCAEKEDRK
jgi:hypothetical protein